MSNPTRRTARDARLKWVPITSMRVNPMAQRELNQARVDHLAANFDLEEIGTPTVNLRDGHYYIIDGQHRIAALCEIGFGDEQIQCWAYEGLSEQDEAEKFLKLNNVSTVQAMPKFRAAITAGRSEECEIDRVVRANGLVVSADKVPGAIGAVATLQRVYRRSDSKTLARTLRLIRDAYGDPGLEAPVIDGLGMLTARYNGDLNDEEAVKKLAAAHGGVNGLLGKAEVLRKTTGKPKGQCVAAAAVEIINGGRGGRKIPSWWAES